MKKYDTIVEVEKNIDEIEEVAKFNPFHDAKGRFSSSNGFASYSANPNTRAGAMAIARSAAAGHMNTKNVHRYAAGPTIRQNANWLGAGKQQTRGQKGSATLNRRVEPVAGLSGASATGASWQYQNQKQGIATTLSGKQTQQPQKPAQKPQQQPQKPQQQAQQQAATQQQAAAQKPAQQPQAAGKGLAAQVAGVQLTGGDKLAIQPRNGSGRTTTTRKLANDHDQDIVVGKDISKTADISKVRGSKDPIDKMADLQGWNKQPTVTNDLETFQKAAKQSGVMLIRTVHGNYNTGETSDQVCKTTMTNASAPLGGSGGKVYGSGMYLVGAQTTNKTGRNLGRQIAGSQTHSAAYGDTQMMATVHPKAKIATPTQANKLKSDFRNMSYAQQKKYGDYGSYIASKGYDGARWHNTSDPYITMYNKSAMIFYGGVADV